MTTHIPVLTAETLFHLQPERGGLFVDCTVGLGGHARALLMHPSPQTALRTVGERQLSGVPSSG